ncbi:MAG: class I SAM-dependent methyltransferase [Candidatus Bathyarchaeia archaeon]
MKPVFPLLSKLKIKSILDCSCGLGYKTVLFAKAGYEVEGSDASAIAIKYAPQLAKDEKVKIRFFRSRYEELNENCRRRYDCVWSDNFDEISTYKCLKAAAKSIYSVLKYDGKFVFVATSEKDLKKMIEKEWKKSKRFDVDPPYKKDFVKVTRIKVAEKTPEGILENNIFLIEQQELLRAEIASIMNPRIKWTFKDFNKTLREVGFREVHITKENCVAAVK